MTAPLPLSKLPAEKIRAVFSDLDDTITSHSKISASTYQDIWNLSARLPVVIVSGRPAGWADCLMRLFPITAMVFENGAGVVTRDKEKLLTRPLSGKDSAEDRARLESVYSDLKKRFPKIKKATDQPYRRYDIAIDFAEEAPFLEEKEIVAVLGALHSVDDVTAKRSSIHINFWLGSHTKVTACEWLCKQLGFSKSEVVYCGDSPNDEPLFGFFDHSVGVSNIAPFLNDLQRKPRYLTTTPGGAGFSEVSRRLISNVV